MSKLSNRLPPHWTSLASRSFTALDLSMPPPGGRSRSPRSVLSLGIPPGDLLGRLRHRDFALTIADDRTTFLGHLGERKYDAVVARPDEDGLRAVRMVKLGGGCGAAEEKLRREATLRNGGTPIFLLPVPGDEEFALVVAPPSLVYVYLTSVVPIAHAILNVDVGAIMRGAPS